MQAYNIILKKCRFYITEVTYLGLIISYNRIKIDPKKVAAIINEKVLLIYKIFKDS
jgi:hypothetical protein